MNHSKACENVEDIYKVLLKAATIQQKAVVTCRDECEKAKETKQTTFTKEEERFRIQKEQIISFSHRTQQSLSEIQDKLPHEIISFSKFKKKPEMVLEIHSIDDGIATLDKSEKRSEKLRKNLQYLAYSLATWRVTYKKSLRHLRNLFIGVGVIVTFVLVVGVSVWMKEKFSLNSQGALHYFSVLISNNRTDDGISFKISPGEEIAWPGTPVSFGIINVVQPSATKPLRYKIWFSDNNGKESVFWINDGSRVIVERSNSSYSFSIKRI